MELSKNYQPETVEEKWSTHWKSKRYFNSTPDERKPFTVVIPPPNVTGVLHMGHTLNETVQDILVRKARMSGFNACWVPGSDHASIATESKVVQMLEKEKGIKKSDLTREEFLKYAFEWKEKYGNIIYHQIEKLGCSVDWDRVSFTMDPDYYKAVLKVFVDLYNKKMIYRGARMINWDPVAKTALSDEEVEYKEIQGTLYYIRYQVADIQSADSVVNEPLAEYFNPNYLLEKAKSIIRSLVQKIKTDHSNTPEKTVIGNVTEEGAIFLTQLTGTEITSEYKHLIDRSSINHILKQHGDENAEENRGQIAITEVDFEYIVDILNNPDEITSGKQTKTGKETITYLKKVNNGSYIYLEEIRTGKKELMLVTMRKMKGKIGEPSLKNRRVMPSENSESFSGTSETTPATANIPKIIDFSTPDKEEHLSSSTKYIIIATQRPETIMGDSGVCVNPTDERFAHLKGKKLIVPLVNRAVPVIFDEYVDPAFGTGALKVTPAHDINDYNLGLKHNLPVIDTLNEDGTLNEAAQICVGMDRFAARRKVVEMLEEQGLLVKEEEYTTRLGFSQRSLAVVEPRISTQWFVGMRSLADKALGAVASGEVKIHPGDKFMATYRYWLENVKDWCISRQLWWGQRIPAWYDADGNLYVAETVEEARLQAASRKLQAENKQTDAASLQLIANSLQLSQDEDVLDTWFSSWLWPIEVFKGVTQPGNADINYYYPTSVLVTGQDIIFFWVARMIMAGMEYMNVKPFSDVYFTGMVRDRMGRKMSKQLGNSPDLLQLIEKFGADAVRFGIMISSPAGNDLLFDDTSPEQGRNFNNKIWNALKLVKMWEGRINGQSTMGNKQMPFAITWFGNRLQQVKAEVEQLYKDFKLSEGLKTIYSLIWDDFCSWYLEWVKPGMDQPIDKEVYDKTVSFFTELMQLLHPYMPFITEEIYQLLATRTDNLCVKQFAPLQAADKVILQQGQLLQEVITGLRDVRVKNQIKPKEPIKLSIQGTNNELYKAIEGILLKQVNIEHLTFVTEPVVQTITAVIGKDKFYIESERPVDTGAQKEELLKELDHLKKFLGSVNKKLSNERFVQSAKPDVVQLEQKKKLDAETKIGVIEDSLKNL